MENLRSKHETHEVWLMLRVLVLLLALSLALPAYAAQSDVKTAEPEKTAQTEKSSKEAKKDSTKPVAVPEKLNTDKTAEKGKPAEEAKQEAPELEDTSKYSCKFYTVDVPDNWKALVSPVEQQGNTNAMFAKNSGKPVVTIVIGPSLGADVKTIATVFSEQFKAKKAPVKKNEHYSFSYTQNDVTVWAYVSVAGNNFSLITIAGNLKDGQNFIKNNIVPRKDNGKLFPNF